MVRTRPGTLLALAGLGVLAGWVVEGLLVGSGGTVWVPPIGLAITLAAVGGIVVLAALPIRRAVHALERARVDPFNALRVVAFAKACALAGSLVLGAAVGIAAFVLTRPVVAPELLTATLIAAAGAVILLVGGLVAESFCVLPPEGKDPDSE